MQSWNMRLGLILFFFYLLLYGGFVSIIALFPDAMDIQPIEKINLAVVYGFALIIGAFLMALLYGVLCKTESPEDADGEEKQ